MASSTLFALVVATSLMICCVSAASTGKAIMAADLPTTPAATTCKADLAAANAQFVAGGIAAVTQIAGATTSHYIFCMDYKPDAEGTAMLELHIEPSFVNVPFSTLFTSPNAAQVQAFVNAAYMVGAATKANGDLGLASYPWDLSAMSNATPTITKTSLIERFQNTAGTYLCGCGISSVTASRRMLH